MANIINWFEIPVSDFDRARKFYGEILGSELESQQMGPHMMGFFPVEESGVSGAIVHGEGYQPSDTGTLVYLNGGENLSRILDRVEPAGGAVVVPKTLITEEIGFYAIFKDSEGNKIALHSRK